METGREEIRDKFQVSYEILRDCMHTYQQFVKFAKAHYFLALISQNHHCPRVLFRTINTVLNTVGSAAFDNSEKCLQNLSHFCVDKISTTRANISISTSNPVCLLAWPDSCTSAQFSFSINSDWDAVGSMILSTMNQSHSKGVVPAYLKGVLFCSFTMSWFCCGGVLEHALMLGGWWIENHSIFT